MNVGRLLLVTKHAALRDAVRDMVWESDYELEIVDSLDDVSPDTGHPIILVDGVFTPEPWTQHLEAIHSHWMAYPFQILLLTDSWERQSLAQMADDAILYPCDPEELRARIALAARRLMLWKVMYEEREFFREAVKSEEELANRILDEHLQLKEEFSVIRGEKEELEESKERLEEIAMRDMLSGLLNRLSLFSVMEVEIDRCVRTGAALSGIMIDIDHFKSINDNYGHPLGDAVIREIGKRLNNALRSYDYAGRYGGEEFFLVLPNTDLEQAENIADRFRIEMERTPVTYADQNIEVTASLGVAEFRPGEDKESWITRADRAMYRAKHRGRNQVCVDEA